MVGPERREGAYAGSGELGAVSELTASSAHSRCTTDQFAMSPGDD